MVLGVIPLIIASGAGAVSRFNMGLVIASGFLIVALFTLFVVPAAYMLIAADHLGACRARRGTGASLKCGCEVDCWR
jgi:Cu/Ag efflux pump CusA